MSFIRRLASASIDLTNSSTAPLETGSRASRRGVILRVVAIKFNKQELALNRSGQMSARQRRAFLFEDIRKLFVFLVLLVGFAGCANAARNPENHAGEYAFYGGGALFFLIAMIVVVVLAGRALRDGWNGRVLSVAGNPSTQKRIDKPLFKGHSHRVGKQGLGGPLITYEFKIGGRSWDVDEGEYRALSHLLGLHRVYYAVHTLRILSYEDAQD
jgi:hypothetical protein